MSPTGRTLIVGGAAMIALGLAFEFGGRYLRLGRLPGDIAVEREHFRFYFPVVTCVILSAVLSLILNLIGKMAGK